MIRRSISTGDQRRFRESASLAALVLIVALAPAFACSASDGGSSNTAGRDAKLGSPPSTSSSSPDASAPASPASATLHYQIYGAPKRDDGEVYRGEGYHHASTVARVGSTTYVAWNGNLYNSSEGQPGQVILLSQSGNGATGTWSAPQIPFVRAYRALDERFGAIDAAPGAADDDHRIRQTSSRQWQPGLIVFNGKLIMFWGLDRTTAGAAMMMSVAEPDLLQWRSHELHFNAADGTPYMVPIENVGASTFVPPQDPATLLIQDGMAKAYPNARGVSSVPTDLNINDISSSYLDAEALDGETPVTMPVSLRGHRLLPFAGQPVVIHPLGGVPLLAVPIILEQTAVDWNNLAVKIPALLTTTDLVSW